MTTPTPTTTTGTRPTGWVLAIDFGTSNTAAAVRNSDGTVGVVALSHQSNLMPSAVFVSSPEEILVGRVALNRAATNPAAFIAAPKRSVPHGVVNANGYDVPVQHPVAAVLRAVLDRAIAEHRGQWPDRLVLSHPEAWSPAEIRVLVEAAGLAGVPADRVSTISEPRAAARHYWRGEQLAAGERIGVFDFGGGTLDVAVLAATGSGDFTVVAAGGDNQLGGKNLDSVLRRWVDAQLREDNPDLLDFLRRGGAPMDLLRSLDDSIRHAKELLSETAQATITVIDPRDDSRHTFTVHRAEFEDLIGEQIDRGVALARDTFARAGIGRPSDLRALFLTGGSSRIPLVHKRLQPLGPVATLDDPKTVVARGALAAPPAVASPAPKPPPTPVVAPSDGGAGRGKRRGRLIAAIAAAVVILAGAGIVVAQALGGTDDDTSTDATAVRQTSPDDEDAIRDLIPKYLAAAGPGIDNPAVLPMQCSTITRPTNGEAAPADRVFGLADIVSVNVTGDTASARVTFTTTTGGRTTGPDSVVFNFAYEDGWKFCGAED